MASNTRIFPDGIITTDTLSSVSASPPEEADFHTYTLGAANLVMGQNAIAVEVHQTTQEFDDMLPRSGIMEYYRVFVRRKP